MRLNSLCPATGSRRNRKRVGRGIGSGLGKTCGRGHKGQKARSGGFHKTGFEGGQMPLQRRLPKRGFRSQRARFSAEIRLHELAKVEGDVVDLMVLRAARIVPIQCYKAKIIDSGEVTRSFTIRGIGVTRGARAAIEQAGGTIEN